MKAWMQPLAELSCVKEVRFLGMIGVVELKPEALPLVAKIKQRLFDRGYLFRPLGTVFYLMPPLIISEKELKAAVDALHMSLHDVAQCHSGNPT
jgi:adenosylmethionine-8-amino-7-oxononanoate aminotransferase